MHIFTLACSPAEPKSKAEAALQRLFQNGNLYYCHNLILKFVHFIFDSNSINQGGNIERRDVGDSAGVSSKLSDVQTAIESLTHSVNHMSTQQLVRKKIVLFILMLQVGLTLDFSLRGEVSG